MKKTQQLVRPQNQTEKLEMKEKRKKEKKRKGEVRARQRKGEARARQRKWETHHAVTPWRRCPRPHERDPSCYPVHMLPSVVAYPNRRTILLPLSVARSTLPSPALLLHYSSLHSSQAFNLSFPSKPNIMFGLVVFVFLLMNWCWWFRDCESKNLFCLWFFFGLLALWLSVTLCLWLFLLYYIEKRDRERVEFVKIREYISVVFVCLFFVD